MAAVICGGIGKCVSGCCECVGQVCLAPFKLCGACCEGCGQCCQDSCKVVTSCCSSSFCLYITVTLCLNVPVIVLGITDLPNFGDGCQASYWLLVFWILGAIHIVMAFYMARAVDSDESFLPTTSQQGVSNFNASSGASRMKHLFCYDGWMAVYILIIIGNFVWLCLGAGLFGIDDEKCDDSMSTVSIAYAFGWAFVFCGGCVLCCSFCCGMFRSGSSNPGSHFVNTTQQPTPAAAAAQSTTATQASAAAASSATTDKKPFGSSIKATPVVNPPAYAPGVEVPVASAEPVPVASAEPIYDDAPAKASGY